MPCFITTSRKAAQDAAIKEHGERLEALGQMAAQLASRQETVLRDQLEAVRRRHVQLCHQLLSVLRHVSIVLPRGRGGMGEGQSGGRPEWAGACCLYTGVELLCRTVRNPTAVTGI